MLWLCIDLALMGVVCVVCGVVWCVEFKDVLALPKARVPIVKFTVPNM